jgi:threonine dehydrogenase-like Zn-dependent dehydrogenase
MKAVVYEGPRQVSVKDVPDARIERPTDVLVRITSANICGSDLHMYEGRTDFEPGRWFGHENLGRVVEVGDGIDKVQVGEYVVLPFQHRLRTLQELRASAHELLPDGAARAEHGGRGVRLRRHGSLRRGTGRAAARALG